MGDAPLPLLVAVFDCNVYAQALISRNGPAGRIVAAARDRRVGLAVSDYVIREILELPDKLPPRLGVTDVGVDRFVRDLLVFADLMTDVPPVFAYSRDPDDEAYVDLAVAARADYIVTRDKDLLSLAAADTPDGRAFAARFPGLRVVDPVAFLSVLPDPPL